MPSDPCLQPRSFSSKLHCKETPHCKSNLDPDDAAVLDLHSTTALEGCLILVRAQPKRVPKSDRVLHAQFLCRVEAAVAGGISTEEVSGNPGFPASTERGGSVKAPIAPSRTGQSILEEHPNDRLKFSTECQKLFDDFSSCKSQTSPSETDKVVPPS